MCELTFYLVENMPDPVKYSFSPHFLGICYHQVQYTFTYTCMAYTSPEFMQMSKDHQNICFGKWWVHLCIPNIAKYKNCVLGSCYQNYRKNVNFKPDGWPD